MNEFNKDVISAFGNRLRVRVSGICIQNNEILLVKHLSLGPKGLFWAPPGGGIQFGESAEESLVREFKEETGLDIEVLNFLFVQEYLEKPLHSIELFFHIQVTGGELVKGYDPELGPDQQIITEVKYVDFNVLAKMDQALLHNMFKLAKSPSELLNLKGYYLDHR